MILIKQNNQIYEVSFKYDPTLVNLIKNVPGKCWIDVAKHWTIPCDKLGFFLNQLKDTMYENQVKLISHEDINKNATFDTSTKIPDIDISDVNFRVKKGFHPYPHQLDFMKYALHRQKCGNMAGFILADEQGCAKTIECANLAVYNREHYNFCRCLIICCVNPAKYHWYSDIVEHTQNEYVPYILGSRIKKRSGIIHSDTGNAEKLKDLQSLHMYGDESYPELPYFVIMNIEGIRAKNGKKYPIADEIIKLCNSGQISMIAIDEIHKNTSPTSSQGKQLLRIKKNCPHVQWIPITGTLITSKPTDAFLALKLVNGHNYSSFYTWKQQFCIFGSYGTDDIIAYKNIPILKSMVDKNMIRRLKKDVLKDLPPKIYYTEYVENSSYQKRLYKDVVSDMISHKSSILASVNPLSQFLHLRQVNGSPELIDQSLDIYDESNYKSKNAKYARLLDILADIADRHEKVVIFSNWVKPLRTLYNFLKSKYNICVYTGTMKDEDREKHKQVFIHNPKYTIMLGTIGALGTMHTLTVANNVIFYDEPWTATDKVQAEDRCHRVGTVSSVNIYTLITKDTIDEKVHDILYKKQSISNYIVDNIDIHNNPDLFDLLLSDTLK